MSAGLKRVTKGQVTWLAVSSTEQLATALCHLRPGGPGAYGIEYTGGDRIQRYVFPVPIFRKLWEEAAGFDFAAEEVGRIFLGGAPAPSIRAGTAPKGPAYESESGAIWVPARSRSRRDAWARAAEADVVRGEGWAKPRFRSAAGLDLFARLEMPTQKAPILPDGTADLLHRTPHLEVMPDGDLRPGAKLRVEVFCDLAPARAGERVEEIVFELPPGQDEVPLQAWLALSPHFEGASLVGEVVVAADEQASTRASFDLVVAADPPPGPGQISAVFHHGGRPCGQVTRAVPLGGQAAEPRDGGAGGDAPPPRSPRVAPRAYTQRAGLAIEIKASDHSEQEFACRAITDLLPDRLDPPPTRWRLSTRAPDLVQGFMEGFTEEGLSDEERISRLRGAGMALWKAVPEEVRQVFWELIDAGTPPHSIFVASDEWSFPWELVVPHRGAGAEREERQPLGVEFPLGRWVTEDMVSPPQRVDVVDSYVFAPDYPPEYALPNSAAEASYVCQNLNGEAIVPGNYQPLDSTFGNRGVALAHFACHGETSTTTSQVLRLEDGRKLQSHQVAAMPGLSGALAAKRPFVFLNACEVGRGQPALVGVGGFATEFVMAGATCVVAPLWSVDDEIAHTLATELYDELRLNPGTTPAAALRGLRGRAYNGGGADSWAAYCFYGDPLTTIAVH